MTNSNADFKTNTGHDTQESRFINVKSRRFLLIVILFIFVLILAFFFGEGGIIDIIATQAKIDQLKQRVNTLEKEKQSLIKEIDELTKDPRALERKAREKLWLMKKNEKVVVIIKKNQPSTNDNNTPTEPKEKTNPPSTNEPGTQPEKKQVKKTTSPASTLSSFSAKKKLF